MKKQYRILSLVIAMVMIATVGVMLAGCVQPVEDPDGYTYRRRTTVSPSNWNELTYQDDNDRQILNYIISNLFTYDFKFDNSGNVIDDDFDVKFEMASGLVDITAEYAADEELAEKWGLDGDETANRVWKITLRNDLKWDDNTAIKAEDFVYSMKEQLNPLFKNKRADSYYGTSTSIHNSWYYVFQGSLDLFDAEFVLGEYNPADDSKLIFSLGNTLSGVGQVSAMRTYWGIPATATAAQVANSIKKNGASNLDLDVVATMEGKTLTEIKASPSMKAQWDIIYKDFWADDPDGTEEYLHFFLTEAEVPELDFSEVGLFVGANEYELIIVLDNELTLLKEDGSLSFEAAYNMQSLPLVKKALYESCKKAPSSSTLWTSNYNSDVATSASFGPYKLTSYQSGRQYVLERNTNWFGYALPEYEGQFQTTKIVTETVSEWNTAWQMFLKGELDTVGIDVSIADDYKNSERAMFTPDDFVSSLQLQSDKAMLKARQRTGVNKTILTYNDFRKAMSLAINRVEYASTCTTSSLAGLGLFGPAHYYDVANNGIYRLTDIAKETLLLTYGFTKTGANSWSDGTNTYNSLNAAYNALSGYDVAAAKTLVTKAYNDALAANDIKAGDKVVLTYGSASDSAAVRRTYNFFVAAWTEMVKGTPLEGKLQIEFDGTFGDAWADDFRAGAYDICAGGWSGAAWDPAYMITAYITYNTRYATAYTGTETNITLTIPGFNNDEPIELSVKDWTNSLNGVNGAPYNFSSAKLDEEYRLMILAALEKEYLLTYYSVPLAYRYTADLLSYKVEFITYKYNTFMAYGGIQYMTYNYNNQEWADWVRSQGRNGINYK